MTRLTRVTLVTLCGTVVSAAAAGQNASPPGIARASVGLPGAAADADTLNSYDARALRVESHGQEVRIYRGIKDEPIAQTGMFHSFDLVKIVAPSENAMREAQEFNRNYGPGAFTSALGGLILGVALAFDLNSDPNWAIAAGEVGGAGLALYGLRRLNLSYSALSKSVWWYNREIRK